MVLIFKISGSTHNNTKQYLYISAIKVKQGKTTQDSRMSSRLRLTDRLSDTHTHTLARTHTHS